MLIESWSTVVKIFTKVGKKSTPHTFKIVTDIKEQGRVSFYQQTNGPNGIAYWLKELRNLS